MSENNNEKEVLDKIKKVIKDNKDLSLEIAKVGISDLVEEQLNENNDMEKINDGE